MGRRNPPACEGITGRRVTKMPEKKLTAPFPYFGGKRAIANKVWAALGDCSHYIEPFFGSGAVLLARPTHHTGSSETVCDRDGFVANVWRAIRYAPDEVAKWCDWPVNHADLTARRKRLVANESRLLENLIADDEWCDPKLAGYWVWAASCWIGSGLTFYGQRPHLSNSGQGVLDAPHNENIYVWMRRLSERLRYVRVVCGDWTRVCGGSWQDNIGVCGMFFDPPYAVEDRDDRLYHHESTDVAHAVREWCLERGSSTRYRIVLAGYEEHDDLTRHGWTVEKWKTIGGYGNVGKGQGKANRHRECLYFSPHCTGKSKLLWTENMEAEHEHDATTG